MQGEPIRVPSTLLDDSPGPYTMSFGFDVKPMAESIGRVGLLHPPLVDMEAGGAIRIVTGYRRILALKALRREDVACLNLSDSGLSASDKLLINLYDNLATRELNGAEKGMALERLLAHFAEKEVIEFYMPLLGLPAHPPLLWTYVGIGRLEEEIRKGFAAGRLSFQTVRAMMEMDPASSTAIGRLLLDLQFNFNQQHQIFDLTEDLSKISDVPVREILSSGEIGEALKNQSLNGPQKVRAVIEMLRVRRFPTLVNAENTFERRIRDLRLPEGVRVHHSPGFESPDFRLEIKFRDGKGLREKLLALASVDGIDQIREPWKD